MRTKLGENSGQVVNFCRRRSRFEIFASTWSDVNEKENNRKVIGKCGIFSPKVQITSERLAQREGGGEQQLKFQRNPYVSLRDNYDTDDAGRISMLTQ